MNKNPDEAFQFLDYVAEVSRSWDEPIVKEPPRDKLMNRVRTTRVYNLSESLDVQAKFETIMRRLDDLEARGVQEIQIVSEYITQSCLICKSIEHGVQSCPTLPAVQDMFSKQANALGTYKQYFLEILHIPILAIQVGGIVQIYHGEKVTMASFSSKETNFRVIRLMDNKVFNHKVCHLKIFNSNLRPHRLTQAWNI